LRTLFAFLVAPLAPGLLLALPDFVAGNSEMASWYLEGSALAGYPVALVLGVPAYFLLRWKGWVALRFYFAAGFVMGAGAYFMAFVDGNVLDGSWITEAFAGQVLKLLPVAAFFGMIGTVAFWVIARPDRPWS